MTYLTVPCPISYSRLHDVFLFLVPSASCKSLLPSVEKSSGVAHSYFFACREIQWLIVAFLCVK